MPDEEPEMMLPNPRMDDLQLIDPNAGSELVLADPNAGRGFSSPRMPEATNSDDPRAKLSRILKALGRQ
jgi:hypothetical protein